MVFIPHNLKININLRTTY